MRTDLTGALLRWWSAASPRARGLAGLLIFSLLCCGILLVIAGLPISAPAAANPTSPEMTTWDFVGAFFKLLAVLALIVGLGVLARRFSNGGFAGIKTAERRMKIIETVRFSPRQAMHLISVDGQTLLVGATDQTVTLLTAMPTASEAGKAVTVNASPVAPAVTSTHEAFSSILAELH